MENKKALGLLLTSNIISGFAQGISMLAIPWYITSILGRPGDFALIYGLVTFASMFWNLYAGTLIDRFPRKNIFLVSSICGAVVLGAVAMYGYSNDNGVPMALVVLVFTFTIFNYSIHYPNLYAFGQEITARENYGKTNSMLEIQGQSTSILSGAFAALLLSGSVSGSYNFLGFDIHLPFSIEAWSMADIFLLDAGTYFVSIILIALIKYKPIVAPNIDKGSVITRIRAGFGFLKRNPLLMLFGNTSYTVFVVLLVEVHLLLPQYVNTHLFSGADVYASAEVWYAIGALFAGISIRRLFRRSNAVRAILWLMLGTVVVFYLCALTSSIYIFMAVNLLLGVTNAGTRILRVTYLFHYIPNHIMGRTSAVFNVINILLRTGLILLFSTTFFSTDGNVVYSYAVCGTLVLVAGLMTLMKRKELEELEINTQ